MLWFTLTETRRMGKGCREMERETGIEPATFSLGS